MTNPVFKVFEAHRTSECKRSRTSFALHDTTYYDALRLHSLITRLRWMPRRDASRSRGPARIVCASLSDRDSLHSNRGGNCNTQASAAPATHSRTELGLCAITIDHGQHGRPRTGRHGHHGSGEHGSAHGIAISRRPAVVDAAARRRQRVLTQEAESPRTQGVLSVQATQSQVCWRARKTRRWAFVCQSGKSKAC